MSGRVWSVSHFTPTWNVSETLPRIINLSYLSIWGTWITFMHLEDDESKWLPWSSDFSSCLTIRSTFLIWKCHTDRLHWDGKCDEHLVHHQRVIVEKTVKITTFNRFFCLSNSPKPRDSSFTVTVTNEKETQQMFTFKKLKPTNLVYLSLKKWLKQSTDDQNSYRWILFRLIVQWIYRSLQLQLALWDCEHVSILTSFLPIHVLPIHAKEKKTRYQLQSTETSCKLTHNTCTSTSAQHLITVNSNQCGPDTIHPSASRCIDDADDVSCDGGRMLVPGWRDGCKRRDH